LAGDEQEIGKVDAGGLYGDTHGAGTDWRQRRLFDHKLLRSTPLLAQNGSHVCSWLVILSRHSKSGVPVRVSDAATASVEREDKFDHLTTHRVTDRLHVMGNRSVTHISDRAFQALADPTRRAVLDLLRGGSQPVGRIAEAFPVSRPAISKHLRVLRQAKLVGEQRVGRHRFCHLTPQPLKEVDEWLGQYRAFWNSRLADLKAFIESDQQDKPRSQVRSKSTSRKQHL